MGLRWLTATNGTSHVSGQRLGCRHADEQRADQARADRAGRRRRCGSRSTPASTIAAAMTGLSSSRWARLAISGTTPPYGRVEVDLRSTTARTTTSPPAHHERRRSLVARRLDAEHDGQASTGRSGGAQRMSAPSGHACPALALRRSGGSLRSTPALRSPPLGRFAALTRLSALRRSGRFVLIVSALTPLAVRSLTRHPLWCRTSASTGASSGRRKQADRCQ